MTTKTAVVETGPPTDLPGWPPTQLSPPPEVSGSATPQRRARLTSTVALGLWLVFALGSGAGLAIDLANRTANYPFEVVLVLISFGAFATVGLLIAARRPHNAIGWIFLLIGLLTGLAVLSEALLGQYETRGGPITPVVLASAWYRSWFWYPLFVLSTAFPLLLFPTGLPSRRWRPVLWTCIVTLSAVVVLGALRPSLEVAGHSVPNPIGVDWTDAAEIEQSPVFEASLYVLAGALFSAVASLIVRFRRASGVERQQLKWFTTAAGLLGLHFAAAVVHPPYDRSLAGSLILGAILILFPVSIGVAILRYRLYAIDLIINRTLVYLTLTALLGVVYFVGISLLQLGFRALSGQGSALAIVISTLAIAGLFTPLRRRIQAFIDRRFYRGKYNLDQVLAGYASLMRDEVDLQLIAGSLVELVDQTIQPAMLSLWIRENA